MRTFPNEGCRKAFDCGKEYVIAGGLPDANLKKALSFCESRDEEIFFLLGCAEEANDLASMEV